MSGAETTAVLQAFLDYLLDAWMQLLNDVLAGSCSVQTREEAEPSFGEAAVRLLLKLEGALAGSAVAEMSPADAAALTARLSQRSTEGAQLRGQSVSVGGLLSQTVALAAKKLQSVYGRTLVTVGSGEEPGWRPKKTVSFATNAPDCPPFSFRILLSEGIVAQAPSQASQSPAPAASADNPALQKANLDRILDVALELKLQFGRRILLLRDLVELAPGSVIELDKRVQEPASLLLGGRTVARGEVVLAEGNYALRVTEICDLSQRLESLESGESYQ
jgi:flagellar motor switch protein FliN/FliY